MIVLKRVTAFLLSCAVGLVNAKDLGVILVDGVCEPNPCENDGHCLVNLKDNLKLEHQCLCSIGFYGVNCTETNNDNTLSFLHLEFFDDPSHPSITAFEDGFENDAICDTSPCENDGICIGDKTVKGGYVCLCTTGWIGVNCNHTEDEHRSLRGAVFENNSGANETELASQEIRELARRTSSWACEKSGYAIGSVRTIGFDCLDHVHFMMCSAIISFCLISHTG